MGRASAGPSPLGVWWPLRLRALGFLVRPGADHREGIRRDLPFLRPNRSRYAGRHFERHVHYIANECMELVGILLHLAGSFNLGVERRPPGAASRIVIFRGWYRGAAVGGELLRTGPPATFTKLHFSVLLLGCKPYFTLLSTQISGVSESPVRRDTYSYRRQTGNFACRKLGFPPGWSHRPEGLCECQVPETPRR